MSLSRFIELHIEEILSDWDDFAGTIFAARGMNQHELRDHAREILQTVARDMEQEQSRREQKKKSRGEGPESNAETSAEQHASGRELQGFTMADMVSEYRALRASVIRRWTERMGSTDRDTLYELTRFNEAMDQALAESTARFVQGIDRAREIFLAVLGHDLRNPLGAVLNSAHYLMHAGDLSGVQTKAVTAIWSSGRRMEGMVRDLLDIAATRLGSRLPMQPQPADLAGICVDIVSEIQAFNPGRVVRCSTTGDLTGIWDAGRLAQLLSNLLGNAIQHGAPDEPVSLTARVLDGHVEVEVHNEGDAIPRSDLERIFEPLVRSGADRPTHADAAGSLGLGLYIAHEIAQAHGGRIRAESSDDAGTTFTLVLPRKLAREVRAP